MNTGNQLLNVNEASNGHLVAGFKDGNKTVAR